MASTRVLVRSDHTFYNSALAHLPSGVLTANAAWLVQALIAFNFTRAAAKIARRKLTIVNSFNAERIHTDSSRAPVGRRNTPP